VVGGHPAELRDVPADVCAVRVEALLVPRGAVEAPEERLRVDADRRDPLPVAVVVRLVAVDQEAHEPALAPAPVDAEVLRQERAGDEPRTVVDPALPAKLAHGGVHQREAGEAGAPCLEATLGSAPGDVAAVALLELRARVAREVKEHVVVEVPPGQLPAKRVGAAAAGEACLDLTRRDTPEVEVRGEP